LKVFHAFPRIEGLIESYREKMKSGTILQFVQVGTQHPAPRIMTTTTSDAVHTKKSGRGDILTFLRATLIKIPSDLSRKCSRFHVESISSHHGTPITRSLPHGKG
jgi:hypothetical protein